MCRTNAPKTHVTSPLKKWHPRQCLQAYATCRKRTTTSENVATRGPPRGYFMNRIITPTFNSEYVCEYISYLWIYFGRICKYICKYICRYIPEDVIVPIWVYWNLDATWAWLLTQHESVQNWQNLRFPIILTSYTVRNAVSTWATHLAMYTKGSPPSKVSDCKMLIIKTFYENVILHKPFAGYCDAN